MLGKTTSIYIHIHYILELDQMGGHDTSDVKSIQRCATNPTFPKKRVSRDRVERTTTPKPTTESTSQLPTTELTTPVSRETTTPSFTCKPYDINTTQKPSTKCTKKRPGEIEVMKPLEYDYHEMIPDMTVLTSKSRRDWDFHDPDVIRAIFVDYETNVLSHWKADHAKYPMHKRPKVEMQPNRSYNLRMHLLRKKREKEKRDIRLFEKMINFDREIPQFQGNLRTNMTVELRRNFIRNQPAVPTHYMTHYARFGKPPFKTH